MATSVTIKHVDEHAWREFKADAIRYGRSMGEHFTTLIQMKIQRHYSLEQAHASMAAIRAKSGNWSGSQEIAKWRKLL